MTDQPLTPEQREARDQRSAEAAVHMAYAHDKKAGIVVDDMIKVERMVERVTSIAKAQGLEFRLERVPNAGVRVHIGNGYVYVAAADKLTGRPGN